MVAATGAMTAGLVTASVLIPFVFSLSVRIIKSVPQSLRGGALGIGATPFERIRTAVLSGAGVVAGLPKVDTHFASSETRMICGLGLKHFLRILELNWMALYNTCKYREFQE